MRFLKFMMFLIFFIGLGILIAKIEKLENEKSIPVETGKPVSYLTVEHCGKEALAMFITNEGDQLLITSNATNSEANKQIDELPSKAKKTYTLPCNIRA